MQVITIYMIIFFTKSLIDSFFCFLVSFFLIVSWELDGITCPSFDVHINGKNTFIAKIKKRKCRGHTWANLGMWVQRS